MHVHTTASACRWGAIHGQANTDPGLFAHRFVAPLGRVAPGAKIAWLARGLHVHGAPGRVPSWCLRCLPRSVTTPGLSFAGDDCGLPAQVGRLLGIELRSEDDLARLVASGISVRAFNEFAQRLPLPKRLVRSVLYRQRRGTGLRLSPLETETALRIARAYAHAQIVLVDDARAIEWFTMPGPYLAGYAEISPLELSMTETGARLVEARLRAHAAASTRAEAADALAPPGREGSRVSASRAGSPVHNSPTARL